MTKPDNKQTSDAIHSQPFGWCFIGAGGIAKTVAKTILKTGRHRIVSVWNRTASKAEKFSARFGCRRFEKVEDAITCEGVEGVYIAVTADQHERFSIMALNLGKPVLCEKPLSSDALSAKRMFEVAKEKNLYLAEAMWTWFNDTSLQVKSWIDEGKIGAIEFAQIDFRVPVAYGSKFSRLLDPKRLGGALLDIGVYPVRYAYGLFGIPSSIEARASMKNGIDLSDFVIFHYPGFDVTLTSSMVRFFKDKAVISGSLGKIRVPAFHMAGKAVMNSQKGKRIYKNPVGYRVNQFNSEFDKVAEEIRSGLKESVYVSKESSIDTMKLLDEIRSLIGLSYAQND